MGVDLVAESAFAEHGKDFIDGANEFLPGARETLEGDIAEGVLGGGLEARSDPPEVEDLGDGEEKTEEDQADQTGDGDKKRGGGAVVQAYPAHEGLIGDGDEESVADISGTQVGREAIDDVAKAFATTGAFGEEEVVAHTFKELFDHGRSGVFGEPRKEVIGFVLGEVIGEGKGFGGARVGFLDIEEDDLCAFGFAIKDLFVDLEEAFGEGEGVEESGFELGFSSGGGGGRLRRGFATAFFAGRRFFGGRFGADIDGDGGDKAIGAFDDPDPGARAFLEGVGEVRDLGEARVLILELFGLGGVVESATIAGNDVEALEFFVELLGKLEGGEFFVDFLVVKGFGEVVVGVVVDLSNAFEEFGVFGVLFGFCEEVFVKEPYPTFEALSGDDGAESVLLACNVGEKAGLEHPDLRGEGGRKDHAKPDFEVKHEGSSSDRNGKRKEMSRRSSVPQEGRRSVARSRWEGQGKEGTLDGEERGFVESEPLRRTAPREESQGYVGGTVVRTCASAPCFVGVGWAGWPWNRLGLRLATHPKSQESQGLQGSWVGREAEAQCLGVCLACVAPCRWLGGAARLLEGSALQETYKPL